MGILLSVQISLIVSDLLMLSSKTSSRLVRVACASASLLFPYKPSDVDHYKWYQRRSFLGLIMDDGNRFEALAEQLATVLLVQEVTIRVLKNKPSHVLLTKCKKILARETKKLLLLEREIYMSQSVDENLESNYWESFKLIGSVLKKVTLMEKA
ncbi:hypothetical protein C5167_004748, partial [Papaver somniferum]